VSGPTIASILEGLGRSMSWSKAAGWDPVGLQVGDPGAPVAAVAVCHEVTEDVVAAVEAEPVDLLVTYHPLLFRPTTRLVAGPTASGRTLRLAARGVGVAAVHTAFDVARGGSADALAGALGLENPTGFGPLWGAESVKVVTFVPAAAADDVVAAMAGAGAGTVGGYTACSFRSEGHGTFLPGEGTAPVAGRVGVLNREPEVRIEMVAPLRDRDRVVAALVAAHPYEEPAFDVYERSGDAAMVGRTGTPAGSTTLADLAGRVSSALGGMTRIAGDPGRRVATVACLPGSGGSFLDAVAGRVDVVVTGDVSHHRARGALDRGTAVIDAGHVPTERPGVRALYAAVAAAVPGAVDLTGIDADPWRGA
jgi:dinuclear metal center YbgI/SA1388 family protein